MCDGWELSVIHYFRLSLQTEPDVFYSLLPCYPSGPFEEKHLLYTLPDCSFVVRLLAIVLYSFVSVQSMPVAIVTNWFSASYLSTKLASKSEFCLRYVLVFDLRSLCICFQLR
ncbi:hypothetical protein KC19_5G080900 [Ceratodon purpureus]|uniref:Uncharacterized protein n=1 Tax=Ceratodon purpureus TaxID=3225 RepID=A0A8T0HZ42_CERPU|nr:hypothetical protein KC19_5G080900 [Ceratodon purpureus]